MRNWSPSGSEYRIGETHFARRASLLSVLYCTDVHGPPSSRLHTGTPRRRRSPYRAVRERGNRPVQMLAIRWRRPPPSGDSRGARLLHPLSELRVQCAFRGKREGARRQPPNSGYWTAGEPFRAAGLCAGEMTLRLATIPTQTVTPPRGRGRGDEHVGRLQSRVSPNRPQDHRYRVQRFRGEPCRRGHEGSGSARIGVCRKML